MTDVAQFTVQYTQHLTPKGELAGALPSNAPAHDELVAYYRLMHLVRAMDTKAIALQRTGKMGTYASTLGQEAIGAAIGKLMQPDDVHAPFYRDYATMLQRGVRISELYAYWGGDERGSDYADNKLDLPMSVPIASQCLHAAGIAYAFKYRKQPRVAVACLGDGGTSQGDFYEAMNVAGAWQLPVVFVVNNNQWAISVPLAKQTHAQTLAQKSIAAGIPGEQVDGNDMIALHSVMEKAFTRAREGHGPTLIEAITYRLCDHTTADDASRYRSEQDLKTAWDNEPLKRLNLYLNAQGLWSDTQEKALQQAIKQQVNDAVASYEQIPRQALGDIFDYHFETLPHNLKQQRDQALSEAGDA